MRNERTTNIAARVYAAKVKWGSELEFVDDTGHWGHGVIDNLVSAGTNPHAVIFHGKAINPRYKNRRAEMWFSDGRGDQGRREPARHWGAVGELTRRTYHFANGHLSSRRRTRSRSAWGAARTWPTRSRSPSRCRICPATLRTLKRLKHAADNHGDWDPFKSA